MHENTMSPCVNGSYTCLKWFCARVYCTCVIVRRVSLVGALGRPKRFFYGVWQAEC